MSAATRHLVELVRRPSVNPMGRADLPPEFLGESRVFDYLQSQLNQHGVICRGEEVVPGRNNLIAEFRPPTPTARFLFECHMDTVPVDGMSIDPFGASIVNGRLQGRGACDVKAGAAAMLTAFLRYAESGIECGPAVTLAFTIDEEHTFLGVQHLVSTGICADFAIVAEPTKLAIVNAHKGVARWTTTVRGVACHSSNPTHGVNAIERMLPVITAIQDHARALATRAHATLGPPTLVIGTIHGGTAANIVPDICTIEIDRRLVPGETAATAFAEYQSHLNAQSLGFALEHELTFACPPLAPLSLEHPQLLRLQRAIVDVNGACAIAAVPFGTNASTLAAAGIPSVVFGPGDIDQAHTHDEWVDLAEVDAAAEMLYRFLTAEHPHTGALK